MFVTSHMPILVYHSPMHKKSNALLLELFLLTHRHFIWGGGGGEVGGFGGEVSPLHPPVDETLSTIKISFFKTCLICL